MFRQLVAVRFLVHVPVLEKLQLSVTATTDGKGSHFMTGSATTTINGHRRGALAVRGASTTTDATTAPSNSTSERMSVRAAATKRPPRDTSLSHCMATLSSSSTSSAIASSRGSMEASKGGSSRHVSKKRRTVDSDMDRGLNVVSRSLKDEEEAEWTDDYDGVGLGLGFDFSINNTSTAAPHHDDDGHDGGDGDATTNDDDGAFQQQPFTLWMIGWDQLLRLSRHKCCESVSQQQHGPIYGHLIRIMLQVMVTM